MKFIFKPVCKIDHQNALCDIYLYRMADLYPYYHTFLGVLAEEEYKKAQSFIFSSKREEYILCRGLLRTLLQLYTGLLPQEVRLGVAKYHKPFLDNALPRQINFNLSHTRDMVAYIFSRTCEVGIDIEFISPLTDVKGLARKVCTPAELLALEICDSSKQLELFYEIWVQKEACLKALGLGLQQELSDFAAGTFPAGQIKGKIHKLDGILGSQNKSYKGAVAICNREH